MSTPKESNGMGPTGLLACCLIVGLVAFVAGGITAASHVRDEMRAAAVKAGVGVWTINPATGERAFIFKQN